MFVNSDVAIPCIGIYSTIYWLKCTKINVQEWSPWFTVNAWIVSPQILMLKFSAPEPLNLTIFGDKVFAEAVKLKWAHRPVGPNPADITGILLRRETVDTDTHRVKMMWRHREKTAIYKPRRKDWNKSFLHSPHKEPSPLTNFQIPELKLQASRTVGK